MIRFVILAFLALLLNSCSVSKYIDESDPIYGQTSVVLDSASEFVRPAALRADLVELSQPKPNNAFWLWVHYAFGNEEKEGGLSNFIKRRFGQDPVYYEEPEIERSRLIMRKYLSDNGYFNSSVSFDTANINKRVNVKYRVKSPGRYTLRNIFLPTDSSAIPSIIQDISDRTVLKQGDYYSLSKLINERERITIEVRNRGYYDFTEDALFYFVDTNAVKTNGELASDLWMKVKPPTYGSDFKKYFIGKTYIYPNYDLNKASLISISDSVRYQDLTILQNLEILKPRTFKESIAQDFGDVYSEERQIATTNHLLDLGIYKFVNFRYRTRVSNDTSYLDRYIYLTPGKVQDIRAEVETTTRAGAFGMSLKGSYTHKNIFHGAERLDLSLSTGFENGGRILLSDDTLSNNLVEVTARADLSFPRFIVPFVNVDNSSAFHIPKTSIGFLANLQRRRSLFTLANYKITFGYDWDETRRKRHQIDLLSLNLIRIRNKTAAFEEFLENNPRLDQSLSNLFIFGSTYNYTYTNQEVGVAKDYFFFLGQLEASGNSLYLASSLVGKDKPYQIFNSQFSQFTKIDLDLRYHWFGRNSSLVTRFSPGIGFAYLNSSALPYIKQYYLGGANSMRAFPIRGLLGSYRANPESSIAESAFDKTGEVKLEWNLEYRFDIFKPLYLKGAFFTDVGNVWLLDPQDQETDPSKVFSTNRFIRELAVGAGFGLRLDIQYIVLRFDIAIPIRKPFLEPGNRWTFKQIGTDGWFRSNRVFNIALGYPF